MPALDNAKHERFAQELAKGSSAAEAYVVAGYSANDGNAIRLKGNERVTARVAEILERSAVRAEITVAAITKELLDIADRAKGGKDAALLNVARASFMDAAKLNGLVIDKSATASTTLEELLGQIDREDDAPQASH